jgi:hypothetical protein
MEPSMEYSLYPIRIYDRIPLMSMHERWLYGEQRQPEATGRLSPVAKKFWAVIAGQYAPPEEVVAQERYAAETLLDADPSQKGIVVLFVPNRLRSPEYAETVTQKAASDGSLSEAEVVAYQRSSKPTSSRGKIARLLHLDRSSAGASEEAKKRVEGGRDPLAQATTAMIDDLIARYPDRIKVVVKPYGRQEVHPDIRARKMDPAAADATSDRDAMDFVAGSIPFFNQYSRAVQRRNYDVSETIEEALADKDVIGGVSRVGYADKSIAEFVSMATNAQGDFAIEVTTTNMDLVYPVHPVEEVMQRAARGELEYRDLGALAISSKLPERYVESEADRNRRRLAFMREASRFGRREMSDAEHAAREKALAELEQKRLARKNIITPTDEELYQVRADISTEVGNLEGTIKAKIDIFALEYLAREDLDISDDRQKTEAERWALDERRHHYERLTGTRYETPFEMAVGFLGALEEDPMRVTDNYNELFPPEHYPDDEYPQHAQMRAKLVERVAEKGFGDYELAPGVFGFDMDAGDSHEDQGEAATDIMFIGDAGEEILFEDKDQHPRDQRDDDDRDRD